jgi:phosphatidylglycerophosphate synthase
MITGKGGRDGEAQEGDGLREWSQLHGGAQPVGLVGAWLRVIHALARPFVRRGAPPDAITLLGLGVAALVLRPAAGGGRWPLLAALLVVLSGVLDGLDGAVAVLGRRVSARGAVLDSICDRLADGCFVAALWLAGAPAGWCVAGGALALLHEQLRAAARLNGLTEVAVISVSERPTRVIVSAAFLLAAGVHPSAAPAWAGAGAIAWTVLGLIGFTQLTVAVVRKLTPR